MLPTTTRFVNFIMLIYVSFMNNMRLKPERLFVCFKHFKEVSASSKEGKQGRDE